MRPLLGRVREGERQWSPLRFSRHHGIPPSRYRVAGSRSAQFCTTRAGGVDRALGPLGLPWRATNTPRHAGPIPADGRFAGQQSAGVKATARDSLRGLLRRVTESLSAPDKAVVEFLTGQRAAGSGPRPAVTMAPRDDGGPSAGAKSEGSRGLGAMIAAGRDRLGPGHLLRATLHHRAPASSAGTRGAP